MYLYNVTIGVDKEIEGQWLQWMKQEYIPSIMDTQFFTGYKMYKILTHDDEASVSYSVQYFSESIERVVEYLEVHAPALVEEHRAKFKDRHVVFNTLLEEI